MPAGFWLKLRDPPTGIGEELVRNERRAEEAGDLFLV